MVVLWKHAGEFRIAASLIFCVISYDVNTTLRPSMASRARCEGVSGLMVNFTRVCGPVITRSCTSMVQKPTRSSWLPTQYKALLSTVHRCYLDDGFP